MKASNDPTNDRWTVGSDAHDTNDRLRCYGCSTLTYYFAVWNHDVPSVLYGNSKNEREKNKTMAKNAVAVLSNMKCVEVMSVRSVLKESCLKMLCEMF